MARPPILIASAPRSGTSMVAGLLHAHGVKVGDHSPGPHNPKGHFENRAMKAYLHRLLEPVALNPINGPVVLLRAPTDMADKLRACVNPEPCEPWLLKEQKLLWVYDQLRHAWPDALWVLPRRDRKSVAASMCRHPVIAQRIRREMERGPLAGHSLMSGADRYWEECARRQERIARKARHFWVDTRALARGDMSIAIGLCRAAGLPFDEAVAREWIDPEMWHHA